MVLANKMDVDKALENLPRFIKETGITPVALSTLDPLDAGVLRFKQDLWDILRPVPRGNWASADEIQETDDPADASSLPLTEDGFIHEDALKHAPFLDLARKPANKKKRRK